MKQSASGYLERDAFVLEIHRKHYESLYFFAENLCRRFRFDVHSADDLVQDLYLELITKWEKTQAGYRKYGLPHVFKIMQYDVLDIDRKEKSLKRLQSVVQNGLSEEVGIHHLSFDTLFENLLVDFKRLLTQLDANIMRLYLKGYSYQEIGWRVHKKPATVGTRIHRAKKYLRQHL